MILSIIGIAVAFNIIIIMWKFKHNRIMNAIIDASALMAVAVIFGGSFNALVVGTIGSSIVSIYLLIIDKPTKKKNKLVKFDISNTIQSIKRTLNL